MFTKVVVEILAKLGGAPRGPATARNVLGGVLAMGVTWLVGRWFGA